MELATALGAAASSSALGVLLGGVTSIAGRVMGVFEAREKRKDRVLEIAHEKDGWGHELLLLAEQAKQKRAETEDELKLREAALQAADQAGSWEGLHASIAAQTALAGKSYRWVDAVVALMRPVITVLLWLALVIMFFAVRNSAEGAELGRTIVETLSFSASTALAWWFGDRGGQKVAAGMAK